MDLEDITYSREATIAAIVDYYKFLIRLYLHEAHSLGKSDEVLTLLTHLPYITDETVEISPGSTAPNWADLVAGIAPGDVDRVETLRMLKDLFVKLDWIPISHFGVRDGTDNDWDHESGMMDALKGIYRQHGWPDPEAYRKKECLEAVLKLMTEEYPDSACWREP
ncbi:hypothetical protein C8A05DRAFT_34540 [Staphylotrichum tortipilum]|uniref:Uncharacterized protein n=1 Tax=Staphylotrichum tortipilum TaxID=2831512 RepID=A0AAN6RT30_9PEZI|nr:hypothetical protein C8A05DRAFT_34540 [Staphylotrichum longicolle]